MGCNVPKCNNMMPCSIHGRKEVNRKSSFLRGYDSSHRKWREQVLYSSPICSECERHGRYTLATEADHIIPMDQGGDKLDLNNGQGLCRSCHAKKTRKEHGKE
ncbi:MAG: HNH endonuclease [Bacteroidetes bacterium]|nr:MAG: HNH endonuclease [Bacteroidota bacterium]